MKKIVCLKTQFVVLILFSFSFVNAQTSNVLQIDSCYAIAQRSYPLIKQYELIEKAKEYTISNANKAYLPQLSVTGIGAYIFGGFPNLGPPTAGQETENTKFIGIGQLNQVIWDGATGAKKKIANAQSEVEKSNIDIQLYALKDRINQLYFGLLLIDEQIKQIDIQIDMLNRNVNRLQLLKQNGYALSNELNELRAEVLKVRQHKTEYEFTRKSYLYMLSLFLGKELDNSVTLLKPNVTIVPDTINNRPELMLYENQRQLVLAQSSIDNVRLMPKVGLLGAGLLITPAINLGATEKSTLALAGLSMSWELGGLYTHSGNKNLNRINLEKIQTQEETFLFNNKIQSSQVTTEVDKYREILKSDDEILSLRKSILDSYQLQYDNGTCSLFELINATDKESEARSNKALHDVQHMLATYNLKSTTGN